MKNGLFLVGIIFLISCSSKIETKTVQKVTSNEVIYADTIDFFVDSINFGQRQINKIEVYKISSPESIHAKVFLSEKSFNQWKLKDSLILEVDLINNLHTEVKDFNNDHFNDIIFTTGTAARGANNIQTLVLFSPKNKSLNWIKNSSNFPNLMYNEKLDCIDAWMLSGSLATCFLRIEKDSLIEFASVNQDEKEIVATVLDKKGEWKETQRIKNVPGNFDRFINFNPIEKGKIIQ